jgi:hypothetical protein
MFYIITYAKNTNRYFNILKNYPEIIILESTNKIKSILDFCKNKNSDDIICFLDGINSLILSTKEEILNLYNTFNASIVFSKDENLYNVFTKYFQDKTFGKYNDNIVNTNMFIGKSSAIIDFWMDYNENDDETKYVINNFLYKYSDYNGFKVDIDNKLFYNYSPDDNIKIINNKIYLNNQQITIINTSNHYDINNLLLKLKYKNLPCIKNESSIKYFTDEIIFLLFIFYLSFTIKDINILLQSIFILYCIFIEYQINLKNINISTFEKSLYLINEVMHLFVVILILKLLFNLKCNINKLLILNTVFFMMLLSFFYFKKCILSIFSSNLLNLKIYRKWIGPFNRFNYLLFLDSKYKGNDKNETLSWMEGNISTVFFIILLNSYCLLKINKLDFS